MNIEEIRKNFPVTKKLVYFNHAAVAPLPLSTAGRVEDFLRDYTENGCLNYPEWIKVQERTRRLVADLMGAKAEEIALVKNTSTGISMVARGLKWQAGENVIIPEGEFPANAYPWFALKEQGVEVRIVKEREGRLNPADFEALIDEKTRLISLSWVEFATGFMNDLAAIGEICRRKNVLYCVDAIQGLGVFEMDVEKFGIDFLAADGHKWLLAPEGIGILYVSDRVRDDLSPVTVGWNSVEDPSTYLPYHFEKLRKDARKFEEGSPNLLGTFALGASIEMLLETGIPEIGKRILKLTDRLAEGLLEGGYQILSPRGEGEKSGILIFTSGSGESDAHLFDHLNGKGIFTALRGGGIRLSPHFYNSEEEIENFFAALETA